MNPDEFDSDEPEDLDSILKNLPDSDDYEEFDFHAYLNSSIDY